MSKKTWTVVLIILAIIALIVIGILIYKATKPVPIVQQEPIAPQPGLGGLLGGLLSGIGGWLGGLIKGDKGNVVDCDPNRPGYCKDGGPCPTCGKDYTGCDFDKCDPSRPGYNQCGFPDVNCGFGG